jgi:hypothetical protein
VEDGRVPKKKTTRKELGARLPEAQTNASRIPFGNQRQAVKARATRLCETHRLRVDRKKGRDSANLCDDGSELTLYRPSNQLRGYTSVRYITVYDFISAIRLWSHLGDRRTRHEGKCKASVTTLFVCVVVVFDVCMLYILYLSPGTSTSIISRIIAW